jgi:hypothetical protein
MWSEGKVGSQATAKIYAVAESRYLPRMGAAPSDQGDAVFKYLSFATSRMLFRQAKHALSENETICCDRKPLHCAWRTSFRLAWPNLCTRKPVWNRHHQSERAALVYEWNFEVGMRYDC